VSELKPERKFRRHLHLDTATASPAVVLGGSLRAHPERIVLDRRVDVRGSETAFYVGQPVAKTVPDAPRCGGERFDSRGPHIGRPKVRARKAGVEIRKRDRSLNAEDKPAELKII